MPGLFGQKELAVQQGMKVSGRVTQVHTDHTVLDFAAAAAVLSLHTRGLLPLFMETGFVNEADTVRVRVIGRDTLLQAIANRVLVPAEQAQELLQRSGRLPGRVGHRFDALAIEIGELSRYIGLQVSPVRASAHTGVEVMKELSQSGFDSQNG